MIQTYRADTKALPFATAIEMSGELDLPETVWLWIYKRARSSSTCNRRERKRSALTKQQEGQVHH